MFPKCAEIVVHCSEYVYQPAINPGKIFAVMLPITFPVFACFLLCSGTRDLYENLTKVTERHSISTWS
jgi:hypothetical protein